MMRKQKILLIDDDLIQLSMAEYMLMDHYEVIIAQSGSEALELLRSGVVPHLILLDIVMPSMDGWETYSKIRTLGFLVDVPIVFLTVLNGPKDHKYAQEIGAVDYITKPFAKRDLLARIATII